MIGIDLNIKGCDEAYYAQIAKEMFYSKNWLVPKFDNVLFFEKPPLLFWLIAISFKVFGIGILQAKLPILIFSVLNTWLIYILTIKISSNKKSAYISSLILLTSFLYWQISQQIMLESPVMFFLLLMVFFIFKINKPFSGIFIAISFASIILLKGSLAFLLLFSLSPFIYWLPKKDYKKISFSILIGVLITSFWYLPITLKYGVIFWQEHFLEQIFSRAFSNKFQRNPLGIFFYIINLAWAFLPYSFIFFEAFILEKEKFKNSKKLAVFTTTFFSTYFLSISLIQTKYIHYAFPLLIPFSIIIGNWSTNHSKSKYRKVSIYSSLSLSLITILIIPLKISNIINIEINNQLTIILSILLAFIFFITGISLKKNSNFFTINLLMVSIISFYIITKPMIKINDTQDLSKIINYLNKNKNDKQSSFVSNGKNYCDYYVFKFNLNKINRINKTKITENKSKNLIVEKKLVNKVRNYNILIKTKQYYLIEKN